MEKFRKQKTPGVPGSFLRLKMHLPPCGDGLQTAFAVNLILAMDVLQSVEKFAVV